jgi:hypothetical protein
MPSEGKPSTEKVRSHRDLRVWRMAMELAERIYELTEKFPAKETYRLSM